MQHKSKLSQLSGCSGQQSRNRRPQLANPRMHCAAKSKCVFPELKQSDATDSVTLKSQNNPLTDIKSIYAAFKSCNNFLPTFWTLMKIFFSLRWLNAWDILYTHSYKVPFAWDSKGCCWFLLKSFLCCNHFLKLIKEAMEFLGCLMCGKCSVPVDDCWIPAYLTMQ